MTEKKLYCRLKGLAADKGKSLTDIAEAVGVHKNTLSTMSTNKLALLRVDLVSKICNYLDCKVEDLFILK